MEVTEDSAVKDFLEILEVQYEERGADENLSYFQTDVLIVVGTIEAKQGTHRWIVRALVKLQ